MITGTYDPAHAIPRLPLTRQMIARPASGWTYAHHAHLGRLGKTLVAIWSSGRRDEDAPGQRVLCSTSLDGRSWTEPRVLADVITDGTRDGEELVLTACGLHTHAGRLVAYVGCYRAAADNRPISESRLFAMTTTDLVTWTPLQDLHLPVIPNHGPQALRSGRLVIAGNVAFPYTDDPAGLSGWQMTGIYPADRTDMRDDPGIFWRVREWVGYPVALCEGAFMQTNDGVVRMLLRSTGHAFAGRLWASESRDDGATWSYPVETGVTDCDTKFHLGRLPDGRFYYVGCPDPAHREVRSALVLSLSRDGRHFDQHVMIADEPYQRSAEGRYKHGEYGYPHTLIDGDALLVIISRQKEAIELLRIPLASLPPVAV